MCVCACACACVHVRVRATPLLQHTLHYQRDATQAPPKLRLCAPVACGAARDLVLVPNWDAWTLNISAKLPSSLPQTLGTPLPLSSQHQFYCNRTPELPTNTSCTLTHTDMLHMCAHARTHARKHTHITQTSDLKGRPFRCVSPR
jgi:hypothetical protein